LEASAFAEEKSPAFQLVAAVNLQVDKWTGRATRLFILVKPSVDIPEVFLYLGTHRLSLLG